MRRIPVAPGPGGGESGWAADSQRRCGTAQSLDLTLARAFGVQHRTVCVAQQRVERGQFDLMGDVIGHREAHRRRQVKRLIVVDERRGAR